VFVPIGVCIFVFVDVRAWVWVRVVIIRLKSSEIRVVKVQEISIDFIYILRHGRIISISCAEGRKSHEFSCILD
jgi:hypothetical protein